MNPFDVLQIPRNSDPDTIKQKYREWMLYLHPDKNKHYVENRGYILQEIQDAYQKCMTIYQERDYPVNNVEYTEETTFLDKEIVKRKSGRKKNKDSVDYTYKLNKKFHEKFEKIKEIFDSEDPEKRGYSEFNSKTNRKVVNMDYEQPSEDFIPYETKKGIKSQSLIKFMKEDSVVPGQLGIKQVNTFTNVMGNIQGTDLKEAFTNEILDEEFEEKEDVNVKYRNEELEREELIVPLVFEEASLLNDIKEAQEHMDTQRKRDAYRRDSYYNFLIKDNNL